MGDNLLDGPRSNTATVDAALRLVTALAETTVENADGVSVTLERHGRVMTVAASDDAVKEMDHHQYDTGEGPCLAAKAEGQWFYIESLAEETRWPNFVPLALEQGIQQHPVVAVDDEAAAAGRAQHLLIDRAGVRYASTRTRRVVRRTGLGDLDRRGAGRIRTHRSISVSRRALAARRGDPSGARSAHGAPWDDRRCRNPGPPSGCPRRRCQCRRPCERRGRFRPARRRSSGNAADGRDDRSARTSTPRPRDVGRATCGGGTSPWAAAVRSWRWRRCCFKRSCQPTWTETSSPSP